MEYGKVILIGIIIIITIVFFRTMIQRNKAYNDINLIAGAAVGYVNATNSSKENFEASDMLRTRLIEANTVGVTDEGGTLVFKSFAK